MEHFILSCLESRLEGDGSLYGRFLLGPFPIGQGITVATALRRTLLSELQGVAITAVEIEGAAHQYSSIVGVRESTLDITLNLKQVVLAGAAANELPAVGYINVLGPREVCASDLRLPNGISCVNRDHPIATVSSNGALIMKFLISVGKSYLAHHSAAAQALKPSIFKPKLRSSLGSWPSTSAMRGSRAKLFGRPKHAESRIDCRSRYGRRLASKVVLASGAANDITSYGKERRVTRVPSTSQLDAILGPNQSPSEMQQNRGSFAPRPSREADRGAAKISSKPLLPSSTEFANGGANSGASSLRATVAQATSASTPLPADKLMDSRGSFLGALAKKSNLRLEAERGEGQAEGRSAYELGQDGIPASSFRTLLPIDAVFMPVNRVNFSLQTDDQWQERRERIVLELWTNGSVTPRQALHEAATCLVHVFSLFRQSQTMQSALPSITLLSNRNPRQGHGMDTNKKVDPLNRSVASVEIPSLSEEAGGHQETGIPRGLITTPSWSFDYARGGLRRGLFSEEEATGRSSSPERQKGPVAKELTPSFQGRQGRGADLGNLHLSVEAYVALKRLSIHTIDDLLTCAPGSIDEGMNRSKLLSFEISEKIKELNS